MKRSFILISFILLAGCRQKQTQSENDVAKDDEPFRLGYHFTPPSGWMNDPNGMVFYDGEYHLFYQHYPDSTVWGPMHWGHAVSRDMIRWEHLPIALYPDSLGYIFSGSAVVDRNNTSGLGDGQSPPIVTIFTYHDAEAQRAGRIDYQSQGIAYSLDRGRSWTKFKDNPVLSNPGIEDFRDPKVMWDEERGQWVMALAVKDHIEFYSSPNLKTWNKLSEFGKTVGAHGGVWECPDLFPLKDDKGNVKWILFVSINPGGPQGGSATQYFIGDFDGKTFTAQDTTTRWIDHGPDNYAGVTWSDIPGEDGRRLFLGWMSNWDYGQVVPTESWRSAMTLPREVTLVQRPENYELKFEPVRELSSIQGDPIAFTGDAHLDSPLFKVSFSVENPAEPFSLIISNDGNEQIVLSLNGDTLSFDRTTSGSTSFNESFPAVHQFNISGILVRKLDVYVDVASVEVFVNDGERVMTEIVFPSDPYHHVVLKKQDPVFRVSTISSIRELEASAGR
jgi:fructan beta-fructosidase